MFHKNIKLILAGLLVVAGIWQFTESNIGNGIFLILLTAIPIFLYFKNEFILLAFLKLRKQDFAGANKWLSYIKNPEGALVRKQQGYLNYLQGIMLSQTNINQAEKHFKKAIELGYDGAPVYVLRGQLRLAQYEKRLAKQEFFYCINYSYVNNC